MPRPSRLSLVRPDIELPRVPGPSSTPARRLVVGLCAEVLRYGALLALLDGYPRLGLAGYILARFAEWRANEDARW